MKQEIVSVGVTICRQSMTKEVLPEKERQGLNWRLGSEKADALVSVTKKTDAFSEPYRQDYRGSLFGKMTGLTVRKPFAFPWG